MIDKISGLDMDKTLEWYASSGVEAQDLPSDASLFFPVENEANLELNSEQLGALFYSFPEVAQRRSIVRKVLGQPTTWFHKDSTPEQPKTTKEIAEALSLTAFVPSYIDYTPWGELKTPTADVWLYKLPSSIAPAVRKIVATEGILHEFGHGIVQPALYIGDYNLKFPKRGIVNGLDAILEFASLAEKHPPISHYAATYRGEDGKFESTNPSYNVKTAISEELCESIAAYFLGFAYCEDAHRATRPFVDRPDVRDFVDDFLHAERV